MLPYERQQSILEFIKKAYVCNIVDLVEAFAEVSESTIRRDLRLLEGQGKVATFHGGDVMIKRPNYEVSFDIKSEEEHEAKVKIAKHMASLLNHGDHVYMDSSTTVMEMLPYINKDITIITNLARYDAFIKYDFKVILVGGVVTKSSLACYDIIAQNFIENFNIDIAFIGAGGVSETLGITYPAADQAIYLRKVKQHSKRFCVVVDSTKFEKSFFGKAFDIQDCEIYTDKANDVTKRYSNIVIVD